MSTQKQAQKKQEMERENRRPNNCIPEKYLKNDKHIEKKKDSTR